MAQVIQTSLVALFPIAFPLRTIEAIINDIPKAASIVTKLGCALGGFVKVCFVTFLLNIRSY
jgi:uncharacterized membrane protein